MKRQKLLASLVGVLILVLTAWAGGVSAEEFEAAKGELQTAQTQVGELQNEVLTLLKDPKAGLAHINDEAHALKELAEEAEVADLRLVEVQRSEVGELAEGAEVQRNIIPINREFL